ncbi:MAG: ChbG/HpnK family deacetylase, partial [Desulfovibrio sp.]|nr:ChbG/HpnK family deacetylase [Desulfovibrio sp.]
MRCLPLADDCGIGEKGTEDIMRCIDAKSLCGASLLAGGPFAEKAAALMGQRLAADPGLRAGAHLNLQEGKCSASPSSVPLLADASGRFRHTLGSLCARLLFLPAPEKKELIEQTAREWLAQVTR